MSAAWRNVLTTTQSWTVSGVASNSNTYTITLGFAPRAAAAFPVNGTTYNRSQSAAQLSLSGLGISVSSAQTFYDSSYITAGTVNTVNANPSTCSVATAAVVPPSSVAVGGSGSLQTFDDLNGCLSTSAKIGTSTTTWSLESDNGTNLFCLNTTARDTGGAVTTSEGDCFEVAENGTLGGKARVTLTQPGLSLVAKNY